MASRAIGFALIFGIFFGAVACGDDGDDSESTATTGQATVSACNAFCEANVAAGCGTYATVDECKVKRDCAGRTTLPERCQTTNKLLDDCMAAKNPCSAAGCEDAATALMNCSRP